MATATLENRIGERMTRQQRADRVALEQQIEWTEKRLAELRGRLADYPSDGPSSATPEPAAQDTSLLSQAEIDSLLADGGDEDQDAERFDGMG